MIIGFAGRKGVGKDTAAQVLIDQGFRPLKFAGPLKAAIGAFLATQGVSESGIADMLEGPLKETPSPFLGGRTPRHAMQTLGDEWGRQLMHPDLWVDAAIRAARAFDDVVMSDVRYPNEVAAIQSAGGLVFRIRRPKLASIDAHVSERHIDELDVDAEILNDAPDAETFRSKVRSTFGGLFHPAKS